MIRDIELQRPRDIFNVRVWGALAAVQHARPLIRAGGSIVLTTGTHGLTTNDRVLVGGVLGNTNANGIWQITNVTGTT